MVVRHIKGARKGWDAPIARKGEKGGTPVPEGNAEHPQRALWGRWVGSAKRSEPIEEP